MRPFAGVEDGAPAPPLPDPRRLDRPVSVMRGVGERTADELARLGIVTVRDLLLHRPRRYELPAPSRSISQLWAGEEATIDCELVTLTLRRTRKRHLTILEAVVRDETGTLRACWFNQAWLAERLRPGARLRLRGAIERGDFVVRAYALETDASLDAITPVYPASEALPSRRIADLVERAAGGLRDVCDPLPVELRARLRLPFTRDALAALHAPGSPDEAERARRRLAFDELVVLQRGLALRQQLDQAPAPALGTPGELVARYRAALPFTLTGAQERAIAEIDADLAATRAMERLLQGDVGAGKTVVAVHALLRAVEQGHQGALMAPTETLAEQHFLTVERLVGGLGVRAVLLTSSQPAGELAAAREAIDSGEAAIAVGTHALIQRRVGFRSLAVAVIDEQHRFGVEQRAALASGAGVHRLHMTATPIPRTLALTVWGDVAISEIATLPGGRKPIVTRWITHERSAEAYQRLTRLLGEGRQAYVVCPLVAVDEPGAAAGSGGDGDETGAEQAGEAHRARAAEQEAGRLAAGELSAFRIGCIHGKLRPAERRAVMQRFAAHELDVLVATTVIEVGVDVPNATVMIVQEADRFGLAQLHQLRGRVGRGSEQSYCLLVSRPREELTDTARERLQALVDTTDGFLLAEIDLELRGSGHFLGTRQTGLSDLRFTRLASDRRLLARARSLARTLDDPHGVLEHEVARMFGDADHRGSA